MIIWADKSSTIVKEGYLGDKFQDLVQGDGLSRISTTYQRQLKYGEEKVVVTLSVACDQNEQTINEAGKLTFLKSLELTDDDFGLLEEARRLEAEKHQ